MTKLILAAVVALTFSVGAFAEEPAAPAGGAPAVDTAPAGTPSMDKKEGKKKHEGKKAGKHHGKKAKM